MLYVRVALTVFTVGGTCSSVFGQACDGRWLDGFPSPGPNNTVTAMIEWDPDGPGPETMKLVVGGEFSEAGSANAPRVAMFDPITKRWSALGDGFDGRVNAFAVLPNGQLVAGGLFGKSGANFIAHVAVWSGTSWQSLGTLPPLSSGCSTLAVLSNGDLIAAGSIVARWNGAQWTTIGSVEGLFSPIGVNTVAELPDGRLAIGGRFSKVNGISVSNVAVLDTEGWKPLGSGLGTAAGSVAVLRVDANGDLIAGGPFAPQQPTSGPRGLARWNGSNWANVLPSSYRVDTITALSATPDGDWAFIGAIRPPSGSNVTIGLIRSADVLPLARVNDSFDGVGASLLPRADGLLVGGLFLESTSGAENIALRTESSWSPLSTGFAPRVRASLATSNGDVLVGGRRLGINGLQLGNLARFDGSDWTPVEAPPLFSVSALRRHPDGRLIVGGELSDVSTNTAVFLSEGDGWQAIAVPPGFVTNSLFVDASGTFYGWTSSNPHILLRRDGSTWTPFLSLAAGGNRRFNAIIQTANGSLVAGGNFIQINGVEFGNLAEWNGSEWKPLVQTFAGVNGEVRSLAALPGGGFVASGSFGFAGDLPVRNIARWDGSQWHALGDGITSGAFDLDFASNGDLLAAGGFEAFGEPSIRNLARWNGLAWTGFGDVPNLTNANIVPTTRGEIAVAGGILSIDGRPSAGLARWSPDGVPWVVHPPQDDAVYPGNTASFRLTPASGYGVLTATWELETGTGTGVFEEVLPGPLAGGASAEIDAPSAGPGPTSSTLRLYGVPASFDGRRVRGSVATNCGPSSPASAFLRVLCTGDLDNDGLIDDADFELFAANYDILLCSDASMPPACPADFNADGVVDDLDFGRFAVAYSAMVCP